MGWYTVLTIRHGVEHPKRVLFNLTICFGWRVSAYVTAGGKAYHYFKIKPCLSVFVIDIITGKIKD